MAEPSAPITGRKRRAQSGAHAPSDAPLATASSPATLIGDTAVTTATPGTAETTQTSRKKARLAANESLPSLPYDLSVKLEEESVSFPEVDEAALSATASTRASTVADLVDEKVGVTAPPVAQPTASPTTLEDVATSNKKRAASEEADASPAQDKGAGSNGEASSTPEVAASGSGGTSTDATASTSRKRARLSQGQPDGAVNATQLPLAQQTQTPAHSRSLRDIPWELVSEILLYTKSMQDVLNLAMSCKFYCQTLLQPSNNYIWKYVH